MWKHFRQVLDVVVVVAVAFATFAGPASAATSSRVESVFAVDSAGPQILGLELMDTEGMATRSLVPQVAYQLRISLKHDETLDRIQNIKVIFYHSSKQTVPSQGNDTTAAVYQWTKGGTFTTDSTTGRTWTVEGESSVPDLSASSGDFVLVFKPGKTARQTENTDSWNIHVVVTDQYGKTSEGDLQGLTMAWYGEINANPATVNFGTMVHGMTRLDAPSPVTINAISNGTYGLQARASSTWVGDNGQSVPYDPSLQASPSLRVAARVQGNTEQTILQTNHTDLAGLGSNVATGETGQNTTLNLTLSTAGQLERGTYNGWLEFSIVQRGGNSSDNGGNNEEGGEIAEPEPIPGYYLVFRDDFSTPEPLNDTYNGDGWYGTSSPNGWGPNYTEDGKLRLSLPKGQRSYGVLLHAIDPGFGPNSSLSNEGQVIIRMGVRANAYPSDTSGNWLRVSGMILQDIGNEWQVLTIERGEETIRFDKYRYILQLEWSNSGQEDFDVEIDYIEVWAPRDPSIPDNYRLLYDQGFLDDEQPSDWIVTEATNNKLIEFKAGRIAISSMYNGRFVMKRPFTPDDFASGGPIYVKVGGELWKYEYNENGDYIKVANRPITALTNNRAIVSVDPQDMGCQQGGNDCALSLEIMTDTKSPYPYGVIDYIQVWVPDK